MTALIGTNAQFHCAGTGNYLVWDVDGLQANHPDILAREITAETLPSSGTVQSNISEQWYYCTMCHWCIKVQFYSFQQLLYIDCIVR